MIKARIYRSSQRNFECKILETGEIVTATALGNLLKGGEVVVGDYVFLEKGEADEFLIVEVEERTSEIFRMIPREAKKKISAANCDVVVIVMSISFPLYKRGLLDRYLIRCIQWGIAPLVVFNKMDEYNPENIDLSFEMERLSPLNVLFFAVSAINFQQDFFLGSEIINNDGDKSLFQFHLHQGGMALKQFLTGKTAIFQGQSGVGKSKLISSLTGGEVQLKSQKLGKVHKGTHTTTWAEIIDCQDFQSIDSPGIRSFSLDDLKKEELLDYFPDLHAQATHCQFQNCEHLPTIKGCSFYSTSQGSQSSVLSRLESYQQILKEVAARPSWEK